MSNVALYVNEDAGFYPTPPLLVEKMLEDIELGMVGTILEPSAGKGNILRVVADRFNIRGYRQPDVDCIEIDANLRQILKYNFSHERERGIYAQIRDIEDSKRYNRETHQYEELSEEKMKRLAELKAEEQTFFEKGIHIVHDDFLTYTPFKKYDLIIMNPPFSNGDKHLLKAIQIQKKGGAIICLLNAETLLNPYTETRKELKRLLTKYDAKIEYIEKAFAAAERKTLVDVALIKIHIEPVQEESDIFQHFKKAEQIDDFNPDNITDLTVTDFIKATVSMFNVETRAGIELIRQYKAMVPYMSKSFGSESYDKKPILRLTDSSDRGYDSVSVNDYLKRVRLKYWRKLLSNPKFVNKLTSKLQDKYRESVERMADYDFTEFNIRTLAAEMNSNIKIGIEDEIIAMFDRLTEEHGWYPETQKNRHYFDGWATNKAHKIGKKVIIPCHNIYGDWDYKPRAYKARDVLEDIERILNFLDGGMTQEIDFWHSLENCFNQGITKNIQLKYFKATFYKKGTIHLVFTCPELIERFNIYAAQNKSWLPPSYGKKQYKDLTESEKSVIDSFQGEKAYTKIIENASYYLAPVTNSQTLMLTEQSVANAKIVSA